MDKNKIYICSEVGKYPSCTRCFYQHTFNLNHIKHRVWDLAEPDPNYRNGAIIGLTPRDGEPKAECIGLFYTYHFYAKPYNKGDQPWHDE